MMSWLKNRDRAHAVIAVVAVITISLAVYDHLLVFYLPSGFTAFTLSRYSLILFLGAVGWVLTERVLELGRARDLAEDSNRAKSHFLAVASHDLRQPLHTLTLLNGLLSRPQTQERSREITQQMGRSISNLELLFNSVLDFSKLEAAAVMPTMIWTPLHISVARVLNDFKPFADAKALSLSAHCSPLEMFTDPALFERVLRNLTENAIKFTDNGSVHIEVEQPTQGDACTIRVIDTGVGIASGEHSEIFEEYYRSHKRHGPRDGLGLGLAIVHRLTTLLDIKIAVGDNTPQGTVFELMVPPEHVRIPNPEMLAQASHGVEMDLSDLFILCVDDDSESLDALAAVLADWRCRVVTASTAEQALIAARLHPEINVVLCDYALSGEVTGDALIQALRAVLGEVPAALVTADAKALKEHHSGQIEFPVLRKPVAHIQLRQLLEVFKELD